MTDSVLDVALEKRFTDSAEIATIDVTSADVLLIHDSTTGAIMRLPFSTLASAISAAFASSFASLIDGKVPASQLPSYVDDVLEYANTGEFPATGETSKIYVALNTNNTYRWSGSAYVEISASPGSTDAVPEGATNLYFTNARVSSAAPVQSVAGKNGNVTLAQSDINGLLVSDSPNFERITGNKGIKAGSNVTPFYQLTLNFGSAVAGTWRKIATVSLADTNFSAAAYKIDIVDPNANYGSSDSANADTYTYYVACVRTNDTTPNNPDSCYVRGPSNHVRAVKTSTGNYEIQISNEFQWREYLITIQCYANNANENAISFLDGSSVGSTGTAQYNASIGTGIDLFQNIAVAGKFACNGATPQAKATLNAAASDLTSVVALCNQIRTSLINIGIAQ